jgi:hypothetical protein
MSGIDGSSNTDRNYAPHMYVMTRGDNPDDDSNYDYVGNATVVYAEADKNGKLAAYYHLGVADDRIVCDRTTDIFKHSDLRPFPAFNIPPELRAAAIKKGAEQLPFEHGFKLLRAFGIKLPEIDGQVSGESLDAEFSSEDPEQVRKAKQNLTRWRKIGQNILREQGLLTD